MKKIILCLLLLTAATPAFSDILGTPAQEAAAKARMERGRRSCPKDKPYFDGQNCRACDDPKNMYAGRYGNCTEICPNRKQVYECGSACILKESPGPGYTYVQCKGWVKK